MSLSVEKMEEHLQKLEGAIHNYGGSVEVVEVESGVVTLAFSGLALAQSIASSIRDQISPREGVQDQTGVMTLPRRIWIVVRIPSRKKQIPFGATSRLRRPTSSHSDFNVCCLSVVRPLTILRPCCRRLEALCARA